jgi:hypothetical protein
VFRGTFGDSLVDLCVLRMEISGSVRRFGVGFRCE